MRLILAQINPIIGDISGNTLKVLKGIEHARQQRADIVVFPELSLCGYPPQDLLLLPHFIADINHALQGIILASVGISVIIGLPRQNAQVGEKPIYNSAAIIENGFLLGFQDKMLLPTYDVFDERRFFEPATDTRLWHIAGSNVAITICEDIWQHSDLLKYSSYQRDPINELIEKKPDLAINLSASPFSQGKFPLRLSVCAKAAITLKCPLVFCNQVGGNDSLIFDGYSLYVNAQGQLVDFAKGFQEDFLLVDTSLVSVPKNLEIDPIEDLYHALVLGISDYFKKSSFSKACLGLSGGIDSALVAYLAVEALGKENVLGILMPSRYSSEGSIEDALKLAEHLGIETHQISIENPFNSYLELLSPYFEGLSVNTAEENLQARIRGMILMAISNKLGYIVLSTGNKSEMAMGYATLYGDMCGGLAVINDVTKQQVYALAEWINRQQIVIPWNTISKSPSAELRPNQKDSDSLPDYAIIDTVLQAYLEEHQSPEEISRRFSYPLPIVQDLIKRIHANEYKRQQAAPGLRVSEKAFSVGRHFPIVQQYIK
ncbi:MAG: NAD+ synthase [Parachlamydiaceae bacterium]|nr:NAD+ synthase [Parachlamydiaceae bacterium]